jgi:SH3-like domain-containing protein
MKKIFFIFLLLIIPINLYSRDYTFTPRYASIKKEKAYSRYNASFDAPLEWIYQKKNLPILIIRERDNWREIRDIDGSVSWMHVSMISNKRTFINKQDQNLLKYKDNNIVNAVVKSGVVGKIINCDEIFCKVKIKNYKGWVEKKYLWGIKKN